MKRDNALRLLSQHQVELHELGVAHAYLFGSVACHEAAKDSDVDGFTRDGLLNAMPSAQERINSEIVDVF